MYDFAYHRPKTLTDALEFLQDEDAIPLAGGLTLVPTLKQRLAMPSALVDLNHIAELQGVQEENGALTIGAMTTHEDMLKNEAVKRMAPALWEAAKVTGDRQVRHRGTIGGVIANADPAADYPATLLAHNATVQTTAGDFAAEAFFCGLFETPLPEGELVTGVVIPCRSAGAYEKFANPASGYPIAGVAVAQTQAGFRVGVTGAAAHAFRWSACENWMNENAVSGWSAEISTAFRNAPPELDSSAFNADIHATPAYRASLVRTLFLRSIERFVF
ncbi:MAG: xanthine dehydrogenase family protein subunit M [Pseudomonadota bacterium]